jgi:hypothetical protein
VVENLQFADRVHVGREADRRDRTPGRVDDEQARLPVDRARDALRVGTTPRRSMPAPDPRWVGLVTAVPQSRRRCELDRLLEVDAPLERAVHGAGPRDNSSRRHCPSSKPGGSPTVIVQRGGYRSWRGLPRPAHRRLWPPSAHAPTIEMPPGAESGPPITPAAAMKPIQ